MRSEASGRQAEASGRQAAGLHRTKESHVHLGGAEPLGALVLVQAGRQALDAALVGAGQRAAARRHLVSGHAVLQLLKQRHQRVAEEQADAAPAGPSRLSPYLCHTLASPEAALATHPPVLPPLAQLAWSSSTDTISRCRRLHRR